MSCNLCFTTSDIAFQLSSAIGLELNAKQIVLRHFHFCFTEDDATAGESICENCWTKVKEFNEFYLSIEACHQRLSANLLYLSPKKENENPYNDEPVIVPNYVGPSETLEFNACKVESCLSDIKWDNGLPTVSSLNDSNCERDRNIFENKASVRAIIRTFTDRPFECDLCGARVASKQKMMKHMRRQHIPAAIKEPIRCTICGQMFNRYNLYMLHKRNLHKLERRICHYCGEETQTLHDLRQHIANHTKTLPLKCPWCKVRFMSYTTFRNHKRRMHASWFSSSLVHKESVRPDHLLEGNPITVDKEESESIWDDANNDSDCEPGVNDAVPKKNNSKIECTLCSQKFTRNGLQRHMKGQHSTNINEFNCDICGARFNLKRRIRNHMFYIHNTLHNQPKPCEICGKMLVNLKQYASHKKLQHTNTLTLKQCHICGRGFITNSKLREHISLHTDTLPLKCSLCDKRFRFSSSLSLHRKKQHPNWDPKKVEYKCHYCDNVFTSGASRHVHIKNKHPGKVGEEWQ